MEVKLTSEFTAKLLKGPNVRLTSSEGAALSDSNVEVHSNEVRDADEGRVPARAINTTIQPVEGPVRTSGRGDLFCEESRVERGFCGSREVTY